MPYREPKNVRLFFMIGTGALILLLGLGPLEWSLPALFFVLFAAEVALILYYQSMDKED